MRLGEGLSQPFQFPSQQFRIIGELLSHQTLGGKLGTAWSIAPLWTGDIFRADCAPWLKRAALVIDPVGVECCDGAG
jgi:hypothetical protein